MCGNKLGGGIERDENRTNNLFWSPEFVWVWNKYWNFVSRLYSAAWTRASGSSVGNGEAHLYTHARTHKTLKMDINLEQGVVDSTLYCYCGVAVVLVLLVWGCLSVVLLEY